VAHLNYMRYHGRQGRNRLLDSDARLMVTLWYHITVFNKNRYLFTVNRVCLSEIDFNNYENINDINQL